MKTISFGTCLCLLLLPLVPRAGAQPLFGDDGIVVSGVLEADGASTNGLIVILSSPAASDQRTETDSTGAFHFFSVPSGEYHLSVNTHVGDVLHREFVSLRLPQVYLTVRLPNQIPRSAPASLGTVSLAQLQHKIPSNARKEYQKGMKAADKGDSAGAIRYLERAIELDPKFVEGLNNLGVQHLRAGDNETARSYFQSAVDFDPGAPEPHANLARALTGLHRFPEAEAIARKAVRLAGTRSVPHFYLALALLGQEKDTVEALHHLQVAKAEIPNARLAIAMVLENSGDKTGAKEELRAFLQAASPRARKVALEQLSDLWEAVGEPLDGVTAQGPSTNQ